MKRRTFVRAVGAGAVGGLAGCAAPTDTETTEGGAGGTPAGTTEGGEPAGGQSGNGQGTQAGTTQQGQATTAQETQGGATETVRMVTEGSNFYFDPIGLFVEPGDTVEWVIESGSHSTTAYSTDSQYANVSRIPEQAEPWDSGILTQQGASFSYTFDVAGTYDYFCIPHKSLGMIARVVCGEPGGVEGDPPDGDVPAEQAIVQQGAISYDEFHGGGGTTGGGSNNSSGGGGNSSG